jgi:hypothetical protein
VLLITAPTKQAAARLLASGDEPTQYVLMAMLTYLAVWPEIARLSSITLDRDYSGDVVERIIVRRLLGMFRQHQPKLKGSAVRMENIAGSQADKLARAAYRGQRRPNREITLAEIEALL